MERHSSETSPTEISILHPDEWQDFKELRLKALETDPSAWGGTFEEEVGNSEEEWRDFIRKHQIYVAKIDGQAIGMLGIKRYLEEEYRHEALLFYMYVVPDSRGQGVARELMSQVLRDLEADPAITNVRLNAFASQEKAIQLYKEFGFKVKWRNRRSRTDEKLQDELMMELVFKEKHQRSGE